MDLYFPIIKILVLSAVSCIICFSLTPFFTHFVYQHKLGKKIRDSRSAPIFAKLHANKAGTPTMGGVLIWGTVSILIIGLFYLSQFTNIQLFKDLNFLSRSQTFLPLGALLATALVGLVDDYLNVRGIGPKGGGLRERFKLIIYSLIGLIAAFWFYFKLDWDVVHVPFMGNYEIGWLSIPVFIFIFIATSFSVNETDGLDGLVGGILLVNFAAFGVFAFILGKYDLATFCGVISGALVAFLWFNINPARFFMGDTGSMALGVTLGIVAMLTNSFLLLPVIGIIFVIESLSVLVQISSKKLRKGKKVFLSSPVHNHLQAIGWPEQKIVMRMWLIASIAAVFGIILFLLDKNL